MAAANRIAGASTCAAHANCSALLYLTHLKQHRPVALGRQDGGGAGQWSGAYGDGGV